MENAIICIRRVVKINLETEAQIEDVREYIIKNEKQYGEAIENAKDIYGDGTVRQFTKEDMPTYREYSSTAGRGTGGDSSRNSDQVVERGDDGGRGNSESGNSVSGENVRKSKKPKQTDSHAFEEAVRRKKKKTRLTASLFLLVEVRGVALACGLGQGAAPACRRHAIQYRTRSTPSIDSPKEKGPPYGKPFSFGGGEGSRTPVRKPIHANFYGCSP